MKGLSRHVAGARLCEGNMTIYHDPRTSDDLLVGAENPPLPSPSSLYSPGLEAEDLGPEEQTAEELWP